jgi:predicted regulator of amino acid metabolism with ACT domain
MTRAEKLYFTFELKKKVVDSLARCGFEVKDGYLPYAKQFELLFTALEPNLTSRRKRLRRIISGTPRMDDAYWVEVLERYSKEVRDISMHYCSVNFKSNKLK